MPLSRHPAPTSTVVRRFRSRSTAHPRHPAIATRSVAGDRADERVLAAITETAGKIANETSSYFG